MRKGEKRTGHGGMNAKGRKENIRRRRSVVDDERSLSLS